MKITRQASRRVILFFFRKGNSNFEDLRFIIYIPNISQLYKSNLNLNIKKKKRYFLLCNTLKGI